MWSAVLWSVTLIYTIVPGWSSSPGFVVEAAFVCNISSPVNKTLWEGCPKCRKPRRTVNSTAVIYGHGFNHTYDKQNAGKMFRPLPYPSDSSYCNITCEGEQHTMCRYQAGGGSACQGYQAGFTQAEKDMMLDMHNRFRQRVAKGYEDRGLKPQPPAANMMELSWDPELERIAQRWADQCKEKLVNDECRSTLDGMIVRQLAHWRKDSVWSDRSGIIISVLMNWFNYVKKVDPNIMGLNAFTSNASLAITMYANLICGVTTKMGCGFSTKNFYNGTYTTKIVCNYSPGREVGKPVYIVGDRCSQCPQGSQCSRTWDGLCASLSWPFNSVY